MALSQRQRYRRRLLRSAFIGYAAIDNSLSINAPNRLTFAVGDQPFRPYDFAAHNLLTDDDDFTAAGWTQSGTSVATGATVLTDDSASVAELVFQTVSATIGRQYEVYIRVEQDLTASTSGRYPCFAVINNGTGGSSYLALDTSTGAYGDGGANTVGFTEWDAVSVVDDTTHWDVRFVFTARTSSPQLWIYPAVGDSVADITAFAINGTYFKVSSTGTVTCTSRQIRDLSSPATFVNTTTAVASDGQISIADSNDDGTGTYTLRIQCTNSGTFTRDTGAASTVSAGTDGTGDVTYAGTIAQINADLFVNDGNEGFDDFTAGSGTATLTLTRDSDGTTLTKVISMIATADPTFLLLSDGTSYLLLSDGTSKLKLSA